MMGTIDRRPAGIHQPGIRRAGASLVGGVVLAAAILLTSACSVSSRFGSMASWNGIRLQSDARLVTREVLGFFWTIEPEGAGPNAEDYVRCLGGPGPYVTSSRTLLGEVRGRRQPWFEGPWTAGDPAWGWDPGEATMSALGAQVGVEAISTCRAERAEGSAGASRAPQFYLRVRSIAFIDESVEAIPARVEVELVTEGRSGRFFSCTIWKHNAEWGDLLCTPTDAPRGHPGG